MPGSLHSSPSGASQSAAARHGVGGPSPPELASLADENVAPPSALHPRCLFETPPRDMPYQQADSPVSATYPTGALHRDHGAGLTFNSPSKDQTGDAPNGALGRLAQHAGKSPVWSLEPASSLGLGRLALPKLEPAGEDVTMATKEAFAAVNCMFGGVMPCYGSGIVRVRGLPKPLPTCLHLCCCLQLPQLTLQRFCS